MFLAVVIATLAVLIGLLLGLAPAASRRALGPLRTLALTAVIGVVALHLLPEALRDLGALGLVVFAAGLALPRWLTALRGPHQHRSSDELGLDLGFLGLLVHHLGDGLALGAYSRGGSAHGHAHTDVLLALVLHTVPLVAVVAAGYARARGVRVAVMRSAALAGASVVGVLGSHLVPSAIVDSATAWIAAGVSGLLLHGLAHDLGRDLPRAPLGRSMDLAMALLGIAVGVFGARLGEHAGSGGEARLRLALVTELDRAALPLAAGLVIGALVALAQNPKLRSFLGLYAQAATPLRGGVLAPEAFLLTLSHFGFPLALLRDLLAGLGLVMRGSSPEEPAEAAPTDFRTNLLARVDTIVPWAALGILVSAVIRASVPDFALASPLWVAMAGAVAFSLSVRVHAAAMPSLAFAVADRGLPLPAALVLMLLAPFALDLRNPKHGLFVVVPMLLAAFFADSIPRSLLSADPRGATIAAACVGAVLLARAYHLGFRGVLLPIVRTE